MTNFNFWWFFVKTPFLAKEARKLKVEHRFKILPHLIGHWTRYYRGLCISTSHSVTNPPPSSLMSWLNTWTPMKHWAEKAAYWCLIPRLSHVQYVKNNRVFKQFTFHAQRLTFRGILAMAEAYVSRICCPPKRKK